MFVIEVLALIDTVLVIIALSVVTDVVSFCVRIDVVFPGVTVAEVILNDVIVVVVLSKRDVVLFE